MYSADCGWYVIDYDNWSILPLQVLYYYITVNNLSLKEIAIQSPFIAFLYCMKTLLIHLCNSKIWSTLEFYRLSFKSNIKTTYWIYRYLHNVRRFITDYSICLIILAPTMVLLCSQSCPGYLIFESVLFGMFRNCSHYYSCHFGTLCCFFNIFPGLLEMIGHWIMSHNEKKHLVTLADVCSKKTSTEI